MRDSRTAVPVVTIKVLTVTSIWFTAALWFGTTGLLARLPMPGPQVVLLSLTVLLLMLCWRVTALRQWALIVAPQLFVLPHLSRFVGIYFLVLCGRGELPWAFAVPGGWGDIGVAVLAIVVLFTPSDTRGGRMLWLVWNTVGLVDILFVVGTAAWLALADPASMQTLLRLPLNLLLTFVVPIIIASHVILFVRLRGGKS